jgi:hypothetical protein
MRTLAGRRRASPSSCDTPKGATPVAPAANIGTRQGVIHLSQGLSEKSKQELGSALFVLGVVTLNEPSANASASSSTSRIV